MVDRCELVYLVLFVDTTVDASEILCSPVEVGSLSKYLQGIHPRWWLAGFLNHQEYGGYS